jgi:hypothetical protein
MNSRPPLSKQTGPTMDKATLTTVLVHRMDYTPKPHSPPIASEKIVNDRKIFFVDLKENNRGRFLKITEDVAGRRDTIMVPMEVLPEFMSALERLIEYEGQL